MLTDVVMPHLSGPELAARLGLLRPGVKVVLMSGYTDDVLSRHAGRFEIVEKPFTAAVLARKVREVLGRRG